MFLYDTNLYQTEEGNAMFGDLDGSEDFYVQDEEIEIETETTEEEEDSEIDEDLSTSEGLRKKIVLFF